MGFATHVEMAMMTKIGFDNLPYRKHEMKFGSLFTGIGGFDLGFERAGMECAYQSETDKFCSELLSQKWPKIKNHHFRTIGPYHL